jgi:hypothetical protein
VERIMVIAKPLGSMCLNLTAFLNSYIVNGAARIALRKPCGSLASIFRASCQWRCDPGVYAGVPLSERAESTMGSDRLVTDHLWQGPCGAGIPHVIPIARRCETCGESPVCRGVRIG